MDIYSPPSAYTLETIEESGIYICKSISKYKEESYLMPRIAAAKIKKLLFAEYKISEELFNTEYKGKGICTHYYKIADRIPIKIDSEGIWMVYGENSIEKLENKELLSKILFFSGKKNWEEIALIESGILFILSEIYAFDKPKRSAKKNNSYTSRYDFEQLQLSNDLLP